MRYVRQPAWYSCGPTAIINSVKWAGGHCTIKRDHMSIARLCRSTYDLGTEEKHITLGLCAKLAMLNVSIKMQKRPMLNDVIKHLNKEGAAAVILYWRPGPSFRVDKEDILGHYIFVKKVNGRILSINENMKQTVLEIQKTTLSRRLAWRRKASEHFPHVWFLEKK